MCLVGAHIQRRKYPVLVEALCRLHLVRRTYSYHPRSKCGKKILSAPPPTPISHFFPTRFSKLFSRAHLQALREKVNQSEAHSQALRKGGGGFVYARSQASREAAAAGRVAQYGGGRVQGFIKHPTKKVRKKCEGVDFLSPRDCGCMKPTVSADFVPPQELANEMESLRHSNPKLIFPGDQVCTQGSSSLSLLSAILRRT